MEKKSIYEWMLLLTYIAVLILGIRYFEYICRGIWQVCRHSFPLICAIFLAMLLKRPYDYSRTMIKRYFNLPKKVAAIIGLLLVYLVMLLIVAIILKNIMPHFFYGMYQIIDQKDIYFQEINTTFLNVIHYVGIENVDMTHWIERIFNHVIELVPGILQMTNRFIKSITFIGIMIVFSAYILYNKEKIYFQFDKILNLYMENKRCRAIKSVVKDALQVMDDFVCGQCLEAIILGSLCFLGMIFIERKYAGIVSVVVAVTAFIPFIGAYIGCAFGSILLILESYRKVLYFLAFFVILQGVENYFIYPKVVGKRIGLPGMWIIASITIWGGMFGVLGMIFSVPLTTFIYVMLCKEIVKKEKRKLLDKNE